MRGGLVLGVALLVGSAAAAQEASLGELAQLIALEDRREYDGPVLERAAQHPDSLVRIRAAMAMGRIGDEAAVPVLLRLLADRDSTVRAEALFALGHLGSRAAVPELARQLDALPEVASGIVPWELATALARIGGPEADGALDRLLQRHPPDGPGAGGGADRATAAALAEAWRLGDSSAVARRLETYIRRAAGDWRRYAVYSAARLRLVGSAAALLEAATDRDLLTRSYATRALTAPYSTAAGIPKEVFLARLRALVADTAAQVRINALRALGTYEDSSLAALAAPRLIDRDPNVPIQAATTLGSLGGSRAATALVERLAGAGSFGLRRALVVALARAAPARALEAARDWRGDPDWRLRALYVEVLAAANVAASRPGLTELLGDRDPRVVGAALSGLQQIIAAGDSVLIATARAALDHPDAIVRSHAIGILARERDPRFAGDLLNAYRRAERDELDDARLAAVEALGRLAQADPAVSRDLEGRLLAGSPRSGDYLVRREVAARFGQEAHQRYWGRVLPVETGRTAEDYRELVRRYVLRTSPAPGRVTMETERGAITIELFGYDAPLTVDNFLRLIERRFFDNGRWHRVVPNFVVQDGDPRGDGSGGPGTVIRDEINRHRYDRGTVGMALSGPDTGGSQFFITHSPQPHLDGGYTVFGQVVSGWDALDQIVQGDRIRRIFR